MASLISSAPVFADANCLVVAHRGASGYVPEHTLHAYELAIEHGADYIELDVVLSKDGVPVIRHEPLLDHTTDIANHSQWQDRYTERDMGSGTTTGWFVDDFTLAEIKTLRAIERLPELRKKSAELNGLYEIPTLEEAIQLVVVANQRAGASDKIGLYIELKHPAYFAQRGQDITAIVLETLSQHKLNSATAPVLIQSFDREALMRAASITELPLVQLISSTDFAAAQNLNTQQGIAQVAAYARGLGVPKYGFAMRQGDHELIPKPLIKYAHQAGMFVHIYTFRAENYFLPEQFQSAGEKSDHGNLMDEISQFLLAGVDGFFIDQPDIGRAACDRFTQSP